MYKKIDFQFTFRKVTPYYVAHLNMRSNENGSGFSLLRVLGLATALVANEGCAPSGAQERHGSSVTENEKVTITQCLALKNEVKTACLLRLNRQVEAENAARSKRIEDLEAENAALLQLETNKVETIAAKRGILEKNKTTVDVLRKILDLQESLAKP